MQTKMPRRLLGATFALLVGLSVSAFSCANTPGETAAGSSFGETAAEFGGAMLAAAQNAASSANEKIREAAEAFQEDAAARVASVRDSRLGEPGAAALTTADKGFIEEARRLGSAGDPRFAGFQAPGSGAPNDRERAVLEQTRSKMAQNGPDVGGTLTGMGGDAARNTGSRLIHGLFR